MTDYAEFQDAKYRLCRTFAKFLFQVVLLCSWPLAVMWRGYAITYIWAWFAVPALGVRPISIYEAAAATILVAALSPWHLPSDEDSESWDRIVMRIFMIVVGPAFILLVGWIWKSLQWGIA